MGSGIGSGAGAQQFSPMYPLTHAIVNAGHSPFHGDSVATIMRSVSCKDPGMSLDTPGSQYRSLVELCQDSQAHFAQVNVQEGVLSGPVTSGVGQFSVAGLPGHWRVFAEWQFHSPWGDSHIHLQALLVSHGKDHGSKDQHGLLNRLPMMHFCLPGATGRDCRHGLAFLRTQKRLQSHAPSTLWKGHPD